jgi:hypothetical protein
MIEVSPSQLRTAVENMHSCRAWLDHPEPIQETFLGQMAWEGVVHIFNLDGHPNATRCYAWSSPIDGSDRRRFYAVLGVPPINSAADAVRAAIVADRKAGRIS